MDVLLDTIREEIDRVGWSETARRSGIDRTSLHRAFGSGMTNYSSAKRQRRRKPSFLTLLSVSEALNLELCVRPR